MKIAVIGCTHAGTAAIVNAAKLYPEAELPKMNPNRIDENTLELT